MHDQKIKLQIKDILPKLHSTFLYTSLIFSLIIMVILALPNTQNLTLPQTTLWNWITKYPLDPALIQLISVLLLVWVIYRYLFKISTKKFSGAIYSLLFVISIMLVEVVMERGLFKRSLAYDRLPGSLSEAFFTNFLVTLIGLGGEKGTSAPSGFVLRQMFLILPFLLLSQQEKWKHVFSGRATFLLYFFNILFLISIPLLRMYRGRHIPFDVGIAVGIGTFIFWLFVIIIYSLVKKKENAEYLESFAGFSLIYIFAIFFYTRSAFSWLLFSFLALLSLGIVYFLPYRQRISNKKTRR